jgi:L-serine dehydratase
LKKVPFPFSSAKELFAHCKRENLLVKDIALSNEEVFLSREEIYARLHAIGDVMTKSIEKGCSTYGVLPGGLGLNRRAPKLYAEVTRINNINDHSVIFNCINAYALAVAEENANGGRIITAPTNGSAGVLPAVFEYYRRFYPKKYKPEDVCDFLLTAGAIAILYKLNASISGAEVGCQGEIGVACSMAAGALVAVLGGNNRQIEKAAEIGMEHNLGLTCDPVDGLVQIPCIERNAIGAIKAIDAALLGLAEGDNEHKVSLDTMIQTMYCTGKDMMPQYKETSTGGLAICFPLGLSE